MSMSPRLAMGEFRRYRTRADPEPRYLSIRDVNGFGEGCGEGAQARPADDAYLWFEEVLWDALGESFETGSKRQLSVSHNVS